MRWCRGQKPAKSTASVLPVVAGCHPAGNQQRFIGRVVASKVEAASTRDLHRDGCLSFAQSAADAIPFASAWLLHKEVLKGNVPFARGEQCVAVQARNSALLNVANLDRDDLIFRLAGWAGERDRF
jgi:hypothetical protein